MAISYQAVGKYVPRLEGAAKATGKTLYTADLVLPRMVQCKVLRSPYAHARIRGVDTTKAKAYPGVTGVYTAADLPGLPLQTPTRAHAILARDEVIFYGQPVAAVLAEDPSVAEEALELIEVAYEELPPVVDPIMAMEESSPLVRSHAAEADRSEEQAHVTFASLQGPIETNPNTNVTQRMVFSRGDVQKAFAESDTIIERTWRASMVHQGYLEPQASVVDCDVSGQYTVWTSTQGQFMVRTQLAHILGVPETQINVVGMEVGGGFGAKIMAFNSALGAVLAKEVRRPVKLVMSRSDDLKAANPAPQAVIQLKTGAQRDGSLTALQARVVFDAGAFPGGPLMAGTNLLGGYYKWPNLEIDGYEVITNKVNVGALRAPGTPQVTFAIESQMDLMAAELGLDPLEFRHRNAVEEGDLMPNGRPYPRIGLKECLEAVRKTPLWQRRNRIPTHRGVGVAVGGWLGGIQPATATVTLNSDGTVSVITGTNDITGVSTSFAQIASEVLGYPLSRIQVHNGDTNTAPYTGVSGGSKTLRTVGHAVELGAQDALDQMYRIVAERLECSVEDLEPVEGQVRVKGSPEKALSFELIATLTTGFGAKSAPIVGHGSVGGMNQAPGFTCQAVEVEVDPETGEVTLLDAVCAQDVGFPINRMSVEGQIQGGVSQALGIGYSEEMVWDDKGVLRNPTLLDYRIPTALDLPRINAIMVEVPTREGPFGAKGVGEPPIAAGAAALANAVANAVGARVETLPVTAERILGALGKLS